MSTPKYDVISSDSHVIEPHDLWQKRVPAEYRERAPRLVRDEAADRLVCDMASLARVGLLAGCYREDDEQRWDGRWDEDVPAAGWDPDLRVKEIEVDGVDAEVVFPTIGLQLFPIEDTDFQWVLFRAYNDWLAEEFCGPHPDRFFGIAMLNVDDVGLAVEEMKRVKELGLVGVMIPMYSGEDNPYWHEKFDPLWAASVDLELPVNLHLTTNRQKKQTFSGTIPSPGEMMMMAAGIQPILLDLIAYGLFDRFPDLTVVSAENDAGWAAHLMESQDYSWKRIRVLGGVKSKEPPSHYFHENIKMTFMRDRSAILCREVIGVESMMWGNDFPHQTSTWPHSQELLDEHFRDQPREVRDAIVRDNVRALYKL